MMPETKTYSSAKDFLGKTVMVTIDRPLGSKHPKFDWTYPLNYGFIPDTRSPDGEELDAYVIGVDKPAESFTGICIAVIHRTNDDDDKLIVVPEEKKGMTDAEIREATDFQEKYFESEIVRSALGDDEMLLCFDDQQNTIAPQQRRIVHDGKSRIWHGIVNIWVMNRDGEILCTKRSDTVSGNPGKWQTYVGGHVRSDSDFFETACREIEEEIGLHVKAKDLQLIEKGSREDTMHVFENYALMDDEALSKIYFKDGEIVEAKWLTFEEYQSSKAKHPDMWCNGMSGEQYKQIRGLNG